MLLEIKRQYWLILFFGLVYCTGLFILGLWPLDFFPENEVQWIEERNGFEFKGRETRIQSCAGGMVFSKDPLNLPNQNNGLKGAVTIEIWLRPIIEPT